APAHLALALARLRPARGPTGGRAHGGAARLERGPHARRAGALVALLLRRGAHPQERGGGALKRGGGVILGIDQGTTGSRALLIDARGAVRARGYAELPQHFPRPGWVEHDGEEIWTSVLQAMAQARRAAPGLFARIAAIGITNQRETTLVWDRRSGRPVHRAIVWQDRRTASICESLKRRGLERHFRRRTGLVLDPYFSGTKLTWLMRSDRGLRRRAQRGDLAFGTPDTWVVWKLSGGRAHVTDPTNASRTLLFDIRRLAWDPLLCRHLEVPPRLLPRVLPSSG